jgi:hypothetical protein
MEEPDKPKELTDGENNLRTVPRFGVNEDAHLLLVNFGSNIPCRILDLSLSGCRVSTKERLASGPKARIEVAFKVRGLAFRFSGVTQWTDGKGLVGIRFVDVPMRRMDDLAEALGEVKEENIAKAAKLEAEKQAAALKAAAPVVAKQAELAAPSAAPAPKLSKRDRRTQAREEVDTSAIIHLIHVASVLHGRILDLSLDGCRIRTDERFPVGIYTRVEIEFCLDGLPFRLGGVVQAIHDRNTIGIRFLDLSSRKREQVEQLIEEMQGLRE